MHGQARNIGSGKVDLAKIRLNEAGDHIKAGGFAGAIGSEQSDNLASADMKRNIRDNGAVAELFPEMLNRKL